MSGFFESLIDLTKDSLSWFLPALFGFFTALYGVKFSHRLQLKSDRNTELRVAIERLLEIDLCVINQLYGPSVPHATKEQWKPFRERENYFDEIEIHRLLSKIEILADSDVVSASKDLSIALALMFMTRHTVDRGEDWDEERASSISKQHEQAREKMIGLARCL